ncbi:unnamed protein product [Rhodiola kirilowii]
MAHRNQQSRSERHSIKYIWDPQKGPTIQLSDPVRAGNTPTTSGRSNTGVDETDSGPDQMLTTGQLVYAIGKMWGYATHPFSSNRLSENHNADCTNSQSDGLIAIASECHMGQQHIIGDPHPKMQPKPEVSAFGIHAGDRDSLYLMSSGTVKAENFLQEKIFSSVQISEELRNIYKWMSHSHPPGTNMGYRYRISVQGDSNEKDFFVQKDSKKFPSSDVNTDKKSVTDNMVSRTTDSNLAMINQNVLSSSDSSAHMLFGRKGTSSHKADCIVRALNAIGEGIILSRATISSPSGHHFSSPSTVTDTFEECSGDRNNQLMDRKLHQDDEPDVRGGEIDISSEAHHKSRIAPAKRQHAVAGAMAGICVSLCLHPVDTVKTVVQSCHLDQKSICDIGRSIVSERGLSGLYRGIASNVASSAPISAVYTFTYESVKGVLLPLFPKEYCSVAHCTAGGCASVATSFIFTPSERIKQQMQVRSNYRNCWNALTGVIQKGGLPSLYAGWGAVLCRNVPHSIIKFYAYENLKRITMSSLQCKELDTLQTLACGGVAGSTAALFSTPFDVVKTRLQTQCIKCLNFLILDWIPGSPNRYGGVFQAILEIRKNEGLKGLYRGLAPRLLMYMTQGGLFFASYEFFKRTLGLGVPQQSN